MRKLSVLFLLLMCSLTLSAQQTFRNSRGVSVDENGRQTVMSAQAFVKVYTITATGAQTSINIQGLGMSQFRMSWHGTGTRTTCTVVLEQSADDSSFSDLIAAQTCTTNGSSVITAGTPNFIRVNTTTISGAGNTLVLRLENMLGTEMFPGGMTVVQTTHDNLNLNANLQIADTDVSTSNLVPVGGAAAAGAAVAGNPVLGGGSDGTNVQSILVSSGGVLVASKRATGADGVANTAIGRLASDASATSTDVLNVGEMVFNGTSWDRTRNNEEITVLASAARTANTDSADLVNFNTTGVMIILDITVDAVSVGLTLSILMKDPVSGKDVTFWTAAAAATGVGTDIYLIYPGVIAADFNGTEAVSIALPRTWVLRVTTADADEATYSVGASYIN